MRTKAEWRKAFEAAASDEVRAGLILSSLESVNPSAHKNRKFHDLSEMVKIIQVLREQGVDDAGKQLMGNGMVKL